MRVWLLGAALLLACGDKKVAQGGADAGHAATMTVIATCAEVHGEAQVRRAGKPYWEPLAEGGTLRDGDWVRTLSSAHVRLEFLQGTSLELSENAVVVVELPRAADVPAGMAAAPRVSVESGEVQANISEGDQLAPLPLLVRTPDGKTTVLEAAKGAGKTVFRLNASDAGVALAVTKGEATLRQGPVGAPMVLKSGNGAVLGDEPAVAPVALPDFPASIAPGIDARLMFEEGVSTARLVWTPVEEADGYRVQIARDLSFTIQARTVQVTGGTYLLKPDTKGLYAWRVATRAANGMVGEYGFARRIFFEAEEPKEMLLGPEDGTTVSYAGQVPTIAFSWLAAAEGPQYRLMASRGMDPQTDAVVNVVTAQQRADVATLAAGEYRWGVYVDGRVLKPLFLKPRRLVVKLVPKAVVKTPSTINKWE